MDSRNIHALSQQYAVILVKTLQKFLHKQADVKVLLNYYEQIYKGQWVIGKKICNVEEITILWVSKL